MLHFSKSILMKKHSSLSWMAWGWVNCQNISILWWAIPLNTQYIYIYIYIYKYIYIFLKNYWFKILILFSHIKGLHTFNNNVLQGCVIPGVSHSSTHSCSRLAVSLCVAWKHAKLVAFISYGTIFIGRKEIYKLTGDTLIWFLLSYEL